jgi:hypothetical protein
MRINYLFYIGLIGILLFLTRCANPVSPTGGPKDIHPPSIINCDPPNYSVHFQGDKIKIEFDEFIQLKDPNNQIVISPPMLTPTDYKLRGKSLIVKFEDSLKLNTTYSINFGEAISDIAESNILQNFSYVFSTGSYIDSLSFEGTIIDAFSGQPQKDVLAMLYMDDNDTIPFDSLPCLVKPYYLTRTNQNGEFLLTNLNTKSLKIFALKDMNNDYLYNLPEEKIGFLDSLVHGQVQPHIVPDTVQKDTTAKIDTLKAQPAEKSMVTLRVFQQNDSVQRILKSALIQEGQVVLYFRYPVKHPQFIPVNFIPAPDWKIEEYNRRRDTVSLWLRTVPADSLILHVIDKDEFTDTVILNLTKKPGKSKSEKKDQATVKRLLLSTNMTGFTFKQFNNELAITCSYPLSRFKFSNILLVDQKDTVHPQVKLTDSIKRTFKILYKWKEGGKYRVIIPDSSLFAINDLTNDSLIFSMQTKLEKDFGSFQLSVNFDSIPAHYIIQLLDEKETVQEERALNSSGKIKFNYLAPKIYKIKAILDRNCNGRWDTGDYFMKIQPEEVFFFPKQIEIRANWEVEESWDL